MYQRGAIQQPPNWAIVDRDAIASIEERLDAKSINLQELLDEGFAEIDEGQSTLSTWLADRIATCTDELAQSLGYFLIITVYLAFKESFESRMTHVDAEGIALADALLETDEELRETEPIEGLRSDDVIAIGQPALVEFIQHHMDEALSQAETEPPIEEFDYVYRTLMIEVIALSQAVIRPHGDAPESTMN